MVPVVNLYICSSSILSNGDHYEGDWVAGNRHGQGILRCTDGTIYDVSLHTVDWKFSR